MYIRGAGMRLVSMQNIQEFLCYISEPIFHIYNTTPECADIKSLRDVYKYIIEILLMDVYKLPVNGYPLSGNISIDKIANEPLRIFYNKFIERMPELRNHLKSYINYDSMWFDGRIEININQSILEIYIND